MANYVTTQDLLEDVLWRAFENTDGSSQYKDAALRYLNRAYRSLWMGGSEFMPDQPTDWWWMKAQSSIIMEAVYNTGTAVVTSDSTIVVLTDTPSISLQGRHIIFDGSDELYLITEHAASDIGMVLDSVYIGDTDTVSFTAILIDYDLPADCLKIVDPMVTYRDGKGQIYGVGLAEMWEAYPPSNISLGTPKLYAPLSETRIRFSHYLDELARFDFTYLAAPDDLTDSSSSIPLLPLNYRHVLADMATFFVMTDKEEARAVGIGAQAKAGIKAMATENAMRWGGTGRPGQIDPRPTANRGWRRLMSGYRLWWGA